MFHLPGPKKSNRGGSTEQLQRNFSGKASAAFLGEADRRNESDLRGRQLPAAGVGQHLGSCWSARSKPKRRREGEMHLAVGFASMIDSFITECHSHSWTVQIFQVPPRMLCQLIFSVYIYFLFKNTFNIVEDELCPHFNSFSTCSGRVTANPTSNLSLN